MRTAELLTRGEVGGFIASFGHRRRRACACRGAWLPGNGMEPGVCARCGATVILNDGPSHRTVACCEESCLEDGRDGWMGQSMRPADWLCSGGCLLQPGEHTRNHDVNSRLPAFPQSKAPCSYCTSLHWEQTAPKWSKATRAAHEPALFVSVQQSHLLRLQEESAQRAHCCS